MASQHWHSHDTYTCQVPHQASATSPVRSSSLHPHLTAGTSRVLPQTAVFAVPSAFLGFSTPHGLQSLPCLPVDYRPTCTGLAQATQASEAMAYTSPRGQDPEPSPAQHMHNPRTFVPQVHTGMPLPGASKPASAEQAPHAQAASSADDGRWRERWQHTRQRRGSKSRDSQVSP